MPSNVQLHRFQIAMGTGRVLISNTEHVFGNEVHFRMSSNVLLKMGLKYEVSSPEK